MTLHTTFRPQFGFQKPELHKCLGYFAVENIDNPFHLTNASNPKEHLQMFENRETNKKHKDIKKGSLGMGFDNFASRIVSITNLEHFEKPAGEFKEVARLTVSQGEMQKKMSLKVLLI